MSRQLKTLSLIKFFDKFTITIFCWIYNLCLWLVSCYALLSGINLFCREMYLMLYRKQEKKKTGHQILTRENDLLLLSRNLALNKNGYLLMLAMLHAKISRKWCASRKCNIKRNKSMSLTKRLRSSFDNITSFGPNGST